MRDKNLANYNEHDSISYLLARLQLVGMMQLDATKFCYSLSQHGHSLSIVMTNEFLQKLRLSYLYWVCFLFRYSFCFNSLLFFFWGYLLSFTYFNILFFYIFHRSFISIICCWNSVCTDCIYFSRLFFWKKNYQYEYFESGGQQVSWNTCFVLMHVLRLKIWEVQNLLKTRRNFEETLLAGRLPL